MKVEKITIADNGHRGFKNINFCDFDAKVHKVYKPKVVKKPRVKNADNN